MSQTFHTVPQHLLALHHELNASRACLIALIEAEGTGIHKRTLDQLDRMIAEIFFPLDYVVYGEESSTWSDGPPNITPAGYAWRVTAREGDLRTLRCDETEEETTLSIETIIINFALVPAQLPYVYFPDLELSPVQLEAKYARRGNAHTFLTHSQWLQAVRNNQTQLGYWNWVLDQLRALPRSSLP
uniref:hypothetical protein n=1 Tax=Pseudomonas fluorescens TaxID=294 RepID=UPI0025B76ED2|nr:hypothetical protein [Pseudomonas fluorescens]